MNANAPPASPGDVGTFFDGRAQIYDQEYDQQGWGGYVLRTRLQAALDLIGSGPGDALDAGMGPGRLCEQLALRGWTVSGVDVSEEMVRYARTRLPEVSERLRSGTIERLPFADASFDRVAATGVLEYVESVEDALRELGRVLRPEGRAVISVPNTWSLHAFSRTVTDPVIRGAKRIWCGHATSVARRDRIPSLPQFEQMLADAGLYVTAIRSVGSLVVPAPLDRLMPAASQRLGKAFEHRRRVSKVVATQHMIGAVKCAS